MEIFLNSFEQQINETILKRGLQYFKKGLVNEPEEISPGQFEAVVEGSELYTVKYSIRNESITDFVCSCPYDFGPVCKHVAAVIFYLQQDVLKLNEKQPRKPRQSKNTPKSKTPMEQVDELLQKMAHDDLKAYVKEQCSKNANFRDVFLAQNASLIMPQSKELYAKQIKAIMKSAMGRRGYIDYYQVREVGQSVSELVQTAEQMFSKGSMQVAMDMACAILEEMTEALDIADDSNGDIGGCIDSAVDILSKIAESPLAEELRVALLDYCLSTYRKGIFKGWDWHHSMLSMATSLVKTEAEVKQLHALLDAVKPSGDRWDWDFSKAQQIRLNLIEQTEGGAKAVQFMEANLDNSDFRKAAIERAIAAKDYNRAITYAQDGLKKDISDFPGLANDWRRYLLQVYTTLKDSENIIKCARYLFLHGRDDSKKCFGILKEHVNPDLWNEFVEGLIKEIKGKSKWYDCHSVANIYIWEERWGDLLKVVQQNPTLGFIENYEMHLVAHCLPETVDLYSKAILKHMENNVGRGHYQDVCRYMRRMLKMGAKVEVDSIIAQLRAKYFNRRALMEELQRV